MKTMRRLGLALLLGMSLVAAACGGDSGASGDGETTTIVVWDRAGAEANAKQAFFEKWNKDEGKRLGITVRYEPKATERYEEIVRLGFQTKRAPDVLHTPSSQLGGFVAAGWVQPLDELLDEDILKASEPYLQDTSELVWGGRPYAIPTTLHVVRLGINRDLFEQAGLDPDDPPTTFSEVEQAAAAITEKTDAYGVAIPAGWVGFLAWTVDIPILATDENLTQDGLFNMATGKFEAERYAPVVEHFRTLIEEETAYPDSANLDHDTTLGAFADGKIAMLLTSGSIVGGLQQLGSDIDFGVGPIPVPDGERLVQSPMNAGFPYSISTMSEHPEEAAQVLAALAGPDLQQALAEGGVPPLSEVGWSSPAAKKNEWLQLFRPTELDRQWPKKPASMISVEGKDTTTTITEMILEPSTDVRSGLRQLSQRYQAAWDKGVEDGTIDPKEFGR